MEFKKRLRSRLDAENGRPRFPTPGKAGPAFPLQPEIAFRVVIADILDQRARLVQIGGVLAVLDPAAHQLTQDAAEIGVAGVAEEAAGVGEHPDEVAQQAQVGQADELLPHAGLVVVEPPGAAVLELPGNAGTLERADHGVQQLVLAGVQAV